MCYEHIGAAMFRVYFGILHLILLAPVYRFREDTDHPKPVGALVRGKRCPLPSTIRSTEHHEEDTSQFARHVPTKLMHAYRLLLFPHTGAGR